MRMPTTRLVITASAFHPARVPCRGMPQRHSTTSSVPGHAASGSLRHCTLTSWMCSSIPRRPRTAASNGCTACKGSVQVCIQLVELSKGADIQVSPAALSLPCERSGERGCQAVSEGASGSPVVARLAAANAQHCNSGACSVYAAHLKNASA